MKLEHQKIEVLKAYFKTKPVLNAYIFGSYARGEADIDILVDLDYTQKIGLGFVQMHIDLEKLLNSKVDLVSSASLSKHIKPYIESDMQLIYAR